MAAIFCVSFIGIALMGFRYFEFVSKTVYEESVSHLTEVFHQSNTMLKELANKNLTYLHMWGEYLQDTSGESEICDYIEKAQKEAGFLYFYFLSADGNYKMATGETGYLGSVSYTHLENFAVFKKLFLHSADFRRTGSAELDLCYICLLYTSQTTSLCLISWARWTRRVSSST